MDSKGRAFVAELLRFHAVGIGTLLVGTLVFLLLLALGSSYLIALSADYAAGILFSYYMNKTFTFRAKMSGDGKPLAWTAVCYFVTYLLNLLLLAVAVEQFSLHVVFAQLLIMMLLAILNYLLFKFFIFGVLMRPKSSQVSS